MAILFYFHIKVVTKGSFAKIFLGYLIFSYYMQTTTTKVCGEANAFIDRYVYYWALPQRMTAKKPLD